MDKENGNYLLFIRCVSVLGERERGGRLLVGHETLAHVRVLLAVGYYFI